MGKVSKSLIVSDGNGVPIAKSVYFWRPGKVQQDRRWS